MNNKKGFTLIELLAVIVVLGIVAVIGAMTVLPYMQQAREQAFRTEASEIVKAGGASVDLVTVGTKATTDIPANSCRKSDGTKYCFTVADLATWGVYDGDTNVYSGTVTIDIAANGVKTYTLNLLKASEYAIIGGTDTNYKDNGTVVSASEWPSTAPTCSCS